MISGKPICPHCKVDLLVMQTVEQYHEIENVTIAEDGGLCFDVGQLEDAHEVGVAVFHCEDHGIIPRESVLLVNRIPPVDVCPNWGAGVMCDCSYCTCRKTRGV